MAWHNKNTYGYVRTSTEAQDNATMVYDILYALGWKLPAVCAMLGNVEAESGYNPWRWQSEVVLPVGDSRIGTIGGGNTAHAYGLCQQDPAAKYIYRAYAQALPDYGPNYSNQVGSQTDGTAQLQYLHWICAQDAAGGEWLPGASSTYGMTFNDFINDTTHSIDFLSHTFFWCYERGTWASSRVTAAEYWYNYFQGYTPPTPPTPPTPVVVDPKMIAIYFAAKKKRGNFIFDERWYKH